MDSCVLESYHFTKSNDTIYHWMESLLIEATAAGGGGDWRIADPPGKGRACHPGELPLNKILGRGRAICSFVRETAYEIEILPHSGEESSTILTVDGIQQQDEAFPLVDDRRNRSVRIELRTPPS
jgi:hypothetical protein